MSKTNDLFNTLIRTQTIIFIKHQKNFIKGFSLLSSPLWYFFAGEWVGNNWEIIEQQKNKIYPCICWTNRKVRCWEIVSVSGGGYIFSSFTSNIYLSHSLNAILSENSIICSQLTLQLCHLRSHTGKVLAMREYGTSSTSTDNSPWNMNKALFGFWQTVDREGCSSVSLTSRLPKKISQCEG